MSAPIPMYMFPPSSQRPVPAACPLANILSAAGHACAAHVARLSGDTRVAQYLGHPTLDQLASAAEGVLSGVPTGQTFPGAGVRPANRLEAPTGIEPVSTALQAAA
jgi:hypothetical protein